MLNTLRLREIERDLTRNNFPQLYEEVRAQANSDPRTQGKYIYLKTSFEAFVAPSFENGYLHFQWLLEQMIKESRKRVRYEAPAAQVES